MRSALRHVWILIALVLIASPISASAAENLAGRRLAFLEYGAAGNRFVELDSKGAIVRQFQPRSSAVIFQMLPNGNVVYAYGGNPTGVAEANAKGETVWNYVSHCKQVLGCERLRNGNTLIGEQGPCRAVEVSPEGRIVHTTELSTNQEAFHHQVRNVHQLKNAHILAAHEGEGTIREYDPRGKIVWEYTGVADVVDALRLKNGNTLIGGGTQKRVFEVTPVGKTVWEFKAADAPELNLTWITSLQVLKNGNFLVGNFLRGQEGRGVHAFEVGRDKKVVWTFADHKNVKSITTIRAIED